MTSGPQTASDAGLTKPPPENWREVARKGARKALFDPYTARDVEIAEPIPAYPVFDGVTPIPHRGWMVCMRANAKNRFGGYTGQQVTGLLIEEDGEVGSVHGRLTSSSSESSESSDPLIILFTTLSRARVFALGIKVSYP